MLREVADRQETAGHGWALDGDLRPVKQRVFNLAGRGLVELAGREDRAELSAWEGRPVRWAARPTPCGHALLVYSRLRPQPAPDDPGPGLRRVELIPAQMTALRLFVALADQLRVPPASGLAERVRGARREQGTNRHVLYLSPEQMESVAYGFWLHSMSGSALEANRFARDYDVAHDPAPATETPALLAVHDTVDDTTAYRAELSARVDEPVLSDDPVLQRDLQLPDSWWEDLAGTLEKVAAVDTDRVAVRQQYMDRAIPEFVGIPAPAVTRWTAAHSDLHWVNLTAAPLRLLDWEGWGRAPEGFDAATLYAYSLLQEDVAARVHDAFPVLGSPVGLAAEATVCAQLLQTVARGDNLNLEDQLRHWSEELRRR